MFWHALMQFADAVMHAKHMKLPEARQWQSLGEPSRLDALEGYREALGRQLLTPAPDVASVNWKQRQLKQAYIGVERSAAERAIADDIAFLDAHPARAPSKSEEN